MNRKMVFLVVLVIIALVALAEALFSNIGTLLNETSRLELGQRFGLDNPTYIGRLLILAALDVVAGVGTILVLLRRSVGRWIALIGFVAYGVYQIIAALTILTPDFQGPVIGAAVFYILIGLAVWWITPRFLAS